MNSKKIERTRKIVRFERQVLQAITQQLRAIASKVAKVESEITSLIFELQENQVRHCETIDSISHRQMTVSQNDFLNKKIESLRLQQDRLEQEMQQVLDGLTEQKIKVDVIEKLLHKQEAAYQKHLSERQNLELLDIVNAKFLETS